MRPLKRTGPATLQAGFLAAAVTLVAASFCASSTASAGPEHNGPYGIEVVNKTGFGEGIEADYDVPGVTLRSDIPIDVYFPGPAGSGFSDPPTGRWPVLALVHGWCPPQPEVMAPLAERCASRGYIVLNMSPRNPCDDLHQEVIAHDLLKLLTQKGLQELEEEVPGLMGRIDRGRLGIGGFSNGATVCALAAGDPEVADAATHETVNLDAVLLLEPRAMTNQEAADLARDRACGIEAPVAVLSAETAGDPEDLFHKLCGCGPSPPRMGFRVDGALHSDAAPMSALLTPHGMLFFRYGCAFLDYYLLGRQEMAPWVDVDGEQRIADSDQAETPPTPHIEIGPPWDCTTDLPDHPPPPTGSNGAPLGLLRDPNPLRTGYVRYTGGVEVPRRDPAQASDATTTLQTSLYLPTDGSGQELHRVEGKPLPTIAMFHGWAVENRARWDSLVQDSGSALRPFTPYWQADYLVKQGYAVLAYTVRGVDDAMDGFVPADSYSQFGDPLYEIRDAQTILGLLVDAGVTDPLRIGVTGYSYGGQQAWFLALLDDRVLERDADGDGEPELREWRSPGGTPCRIAAAVPAFASTDWLHLLTRNGRMDPFEAHPGSEAARRVAAEPVGILREQWLTGTHELAIANGFHLRPLPPHPDADPTADYTSWAIRLREGDPYTRPASPPDPVLETMLHELNRRSPLSVQPVSQVPVLQIQGFRDGAVPVIQALQMRNHVRLEDGLFPDYPITTILGSMGHSGPPANELREHALWQQRALDFFGFYLKGEGEGPPDPDVTAILHDCRPTDGQPIPETMSGASFNELSRSRLVIGSEPGEALQPIDWLTSNLENGGGPGCEASQPDDREGVMAVWRYRMPRDTTLMGFPRVIVEWTPVGGPTTDVALFARLAEEQPDGLHWVAEGAYRHAGRTGERHLGQVEPGDRVESVFDLEANAFRFTGDRLLRLELFGRYDGGSFRPNNTPFEIAITGVRLELPIVRAMADLRIADITAGRAGSGQCDWGCGHPNGKCPCWCPCKCRHACDCAGSCEEWGCGRKQCRSRSCRSWYSHGDDDGDDADDQPCRRKKRCRCRMRTDATRVRIEITVENQGSAASGASHTGIALDGTPVATLETPPIPAGEERILSFETRLSAGERLVRATADEGGAIEEGDETNNGAQRVVQTRRNKVKNGSFQGDPDSSASPEGWTSSGNSQGTLQAVSLGIGPSAPVWTSDPIPVEPGATYALYATANALGSGADPLVLLVAPGVPTPIASVGTPLGGGATAELVDLVVIPPDVTEVQVVLTGTAPLGGGVQYDEVGLFDR